MTTWYPVVGPLKTKFLENLDCLIPGNTRQLRHDLQPQRLSGWGEKSVVPETLPNDIPLVPKPELGNQ